MNGPWRLVVAPEPGRTMFSSSGGGSSIAQAVAVTIRAQRRLEIDSAMTRHGWATAQFESGVRTDTLIAYLKSSLAELKCSI